MLISRLSRQRSATDAPQGALPDQAGVSTAVPAPCRRRGLNGPARRCDAGRTVRGCRGVRRPDPPTLRATRLRTGRATSLPAASIRQTGPCSPVCRRLRHTPHAQCSHHQHQRRTSTTPVEIDADNPLHMMRRRLLTTGTQRGECSACVERAKQLRARRSPLILAHARCRGSALRPAPAPSDPRRYVRRSRPTS